MNNIKKNKFIKFLPIILILLISFFIIISIILFSKFYLLLKIHQQTKVWQLAEVLSSLVIVIGIFSYVYQYYSTHKITAQTNSLTFTELTKKGVLDLETFFMKYNNDLQNLYYEMYGSYGFPKPKKKATLEQKQIEFHAVSYMIQIMEDVWAVLELDKHYDDDDYTGWINTFQKWGGSKTFIIIWSKLKKNYGLNFINFVENHILSTSEELEELEE